jgi:hypothetical protein
LKITHPCLFIDLSATLSQTSAQHLLHKLAKTLISPLIHRMPSIFFLKIKMAGNFLFGIYQFRALFVLKYVLK